MIERMSTMATANANDVALGIEFFGDDDDHAYRWISARSESHERG